MKYQRIKEGQMELFFDFLSRWVEGAQVELEVAALEIGDQIEEEWVQLQSLAYDSRDDVLHVNTVKLEHLIPRPHAVSVGDEGGVIKSISMRDDKNFLQIINFREPLLLPWPAEDGRL